MQGMKLSSMIFRSRDSATLKTRFFVSWISLFVFSSLDFRHFRKTSCTFLRCIPNDELSLSQRVAKNWPSIVRLIEIMLKLSCFEELRKAKIKNGSSPWRLHTLDSLRQIITWTMRMVVVVIEFDAVTRQSFQFQQKLKQISISAGNTFRFASSNFEQATEEFKSNSSAVIRWIISSTRRKQVQASFSSQNFIDYSAFASFMQFPSERLSRAKFCFVLLTSSRSGPLHHRISSSVSSLKGKTFRLVLVRSESFMHL